MPFNSHRMKRFGNSGSAGLRPAHGHKSMQEDSGEAGYLSDSAPKVETADRSRKQELLKPAPIRHFIEFLLRAKKTTRLHRLTGVGGVIDSGPDPQAGGGLRGPACLGETCTILDLVMGPAGSHEVTELLIAWGNGDSSALERLVPLVEPEMRRMAKAYLARERPDPNLQTTAIINEVFLRLIDSTTIRCSGRSHFYALCARVMRQVLVDQARARGAAKRGNRVQHVSLDETCLVSPERLTDVVAIDEALTSLSRADPRKGKVVELRFFGGLSVAETAEALEISEESVIRDWRLAKVWLLRELSGRAPAGDG
jgi:RNA polymerase sigma-70 factor (ECF subfamily)